MSYDAQLMQDGIEVVGISAPTKEKAEQEINHYVMMCSQDGDVEIKRNYKHSQNASNASEGKDV